jgi:dephospho-CoA kinase
MLVVGLSGNRYSGKDSVAKVFKQIGIPVFDVDTIIKFILNYNTQLLGELKLLFGDMIFTDESLDFKKIKNTKTFDKIMDVIEIDILTAHERFLKKNENSAYTIFHSSILFERKWNLEMDSNIAIFSPNNDRIKRCKYITNQGLLVINDLLKQEMDTIEKNQMSDYIIHNYNDETLLGDVLTQVSNVDQDIIDKYLLREQTTRVI